jgi:hypothetical protein
MTNLKAIHTVGDSLITYLRKSFQGEGKDATGINSCTFRLLASGELDDPQDAVISPTVSLYLFRITMNEHMRNVRRVNKFMNMEVPLSVDLHYLLSVWSDSAGDEQILMAWAMQELYLHPVLDASFLSSDAAWQPEDVIQVIPAELSTEEMTRIWSVLQPNYHLSVAYIARVLRIDSQTIPEGQRVIASRFAYQDGLEK